MIGFIQKLNATHKCPECGSNCNCNGIRSARRALPVFTFLGGYGGLLNFIQKHWKELAAGAVGLFVLIGVITLSVNWFQARKYDKDRKQYETDKAAWATDRAVILSRAEEAEKRAAALEPKAIAFDTLAEQHKAADPALVKKIDEVSKNAANEEARAEQPTNCHDRIQSVCNLLRARNPKYDCGTIFRENCGQ